ncbi:thermonuclease family protein [Rhizobium laguerreae]|uniref:thermonuclease family protein n=1 Tax=Rhizobium laguerreae TaxID=1076926 RepID=UPI001C91807F|nr:thermonuclease family protein [Rhizobium laguerreae]MBY3144868.1 thermonuclease family protein [Rhizobium laguerreae]
MGNHVGIGATAIAAACLCFGTSAIVALASPVTETGNDTQPAYERCGSGIRDYCIVDGDTFWSHGVKIRIADIDAPEIRQPHCAAEKALGERATVRLMELVNDGPFDILAWRNQDRDRNGRKLRVLVRGGRSLGDILVSEGLARTWTGRRQPWC